MESRARAPARIVPAGRQRASTSGSEDKRERILRAAEELFHTQGYAETTLEQISAKLGVTKPFVYYYFRNKLQIYEVLSWAPTVACYSVLDLAPDDSRPAHEKVAKALEDLIRQTIVHYPSALFPYRDPQVYSPAYRNARRRIARHFHDQLCTLMEQARADGTLNFRDTRVTAMAACSIPGFLFSWYRPGGRLASEAMVAELAELSWRVIGLGAGDGAGREDQAPVTPSSRRP